MDDDLYLAAPDSRLIRKIVFVHPDLQEDLISLGERLFDETKLKYSDGAIIRGLISIGLSTIAGKPYLAIEFVGARVRPGRKRGQRRKRTV